VIYFAYRVFEVATGDLAGMGIVVISYTIKEISDDVGYLKVRRYATYSILKAISHMGMVDFFD
jgi:hypothetical protein